MRVRRRRTFVVSPGAIAGTIMTLVVLGLVVWIGYEFFSFARTPELRVVSPAGDLAAHADDTVVVRGVTVANASVTVDGPRENPVVTADPAGNFEVTVDLVPGSNVIEITAHDPVTDRDSETVVRTVQMVSAAATIPSPSAAPLIVTQPAADAIVTDPVPIAGTGQPGSSVMVTAALVAAAPPSFAVTDAGGTPVTPIPSQSVPQPATLTVDASGVFLGSLSIAPGAWDLTIAAGSAAPVARRVTVQPPAGLAGVVRMEGGESYVEIDQDGTTIDASGSIVRDGESLALAAARELRIRVGNAGAVRLTINGIAIGAMGGDRAVVEWRITRTGS